MVSVIVPNYNHGTFLKQRIESVLNQAYRDFELIILDDCSTDNSKEIIESFRGHSNVATIIYNENNSGSTFKQWQKGIACASGDLIWIAESDDMADLNFLSAIVPYFEKDNKLGLVYTQSFKMNSNGEIMGDWNFHTEDLNKELWLNDFRLDGGFFVKNYMFYKNPIPNASAVVFKKMVYSEVGGVDKNFTINGDWYLYSKILSVSDIAYISSSLNYFREHDNRGSSGNIRNGNNVKEYYQLILIWKQLFNISAFNLENILSNAFNAWYETFNKSIYKMLQINFLKIFKVAYRVDKKILTRFLSYGKYRLQNGK